MLCQSQADPYAYDAGYNTSLERRRRKIRPKTIWVRFVFLFCGKAKSGAARTYLDAQKEDKVILEDEVISKLIYLSI